MLDVPYSMQINEHACGAACFEMVFRYYRSSNLSKFSQRKIFRNSSNLEPHNSGNRRIDSERLVDLASKRGFCAGIGRVSTDPKQRIEQINHFLIKEKVPLIACQRFTDDLPLLGHFRVILAVSYHEIVFHDPHPTEGGEALRWNADKFFDYWKYTGGNVTGGVAIWIADRQLDSPLDPLTPNAWYSLSLLHPTSHSAIPRN